MEGYEGTGRDQYADAGELPYPAEVALQDPRNLIDYEHNTLPPFQLNPTPSDGYRNDTISSEVNVPDRFELFLLGDGEKKITEATDTRTPNSSIFTVAKEDHTLGNLLRAHLLKDPHVMFAGYRVPHPLFANFELRVQTDGEITPKEALVACCKSIVSDLGQLSREFTKEFELRKMVGGEGNSNIIDK